MFAPREDGANLHDGGVSSSSLVHVNGSVSGNGAGVLVRREQEPEQGLHERFHEALFGKEKIAISVPGDTAWRGAQGALVDAGKPPPDIVLICQDEDLYDDIDSAKANAPTAEVRVVITWDMSWSDVLDELKGVCGRAVLFKYYKEGRLKCVQA